ncbi:alpha/beta-hydrolase [Annulohypoxylon maeteangense]|uniref:alpha/beta-hydrolase n=1 Tax=Annulohypoxylon maeteangense TaxID=1927788 RepID=UPI002008074B|nr:alpha/beta-hydrolase [Annulohypoxylon maeteangense]KAI0885219.1 alpha/beta-hydrolase [Annulohypoxylon maeteangense]
MATWRIVSPRLALSTPLRAIISRPYSSSSTVPLAYDHHEPPKGDRHRQDAPIIFMHGLFGSKKNNRSVSRALARDLKRHVYTVDLRNHGESPHAPQHTYLAMASDIERFIQDHGLKSPSLIGHSMGAKTAMTLALSSPSLIADIVAVDNAPVDVALSGTFARYIEGMRRIEAASVTRQADADAILKDYEDDIAIRHFLLGNLYRPSPSPSTPAGPIAQKFRVPLEILGRSLGHLGDFPFKDPSAARFAGPALFVRGTRSAYVPDEVVPLIGEFFPRFRLVDVDAGHWVISEKPEEFLRAVIEFLTPKE